MGLEFQSVKTPPARSMIRAPAVMSQSLGLVARVATNEPFATYARCRAVAPRFLKRVLAAMLKAADICELSIWLSIAIEANSVTFSSVVEMRTVFSAAGPWEYAVNIDSVAGLKMAATTGLPWYITPMLTQKDKSPWA